MGRKWYILSCKQIHFLLEEHLPNEIYLEKQMSIAMFFYCAGEEYYQYLSRTYPDMPCLRKLSDVTADSNCNDSTYSVGEIFSTICEAIQECGLE